MVKVFFEKTISSFQQLAKEVDWLDLDSGIRTFGDYKGKKRQLVFVTRSPHDTYTLMVYEKKTGSDGPVAGNRLFVKEFQSKEELLEFMRGLLSRPLSAFVY